MRSAVRPSSLTRTDAPSEHRKHFATSGAGGGAGAGAGAGYYTSKSLKLSVPAKSPSSVAAAAARLLALHDVTRLILAALQKGRQSPALRRVLLFHLVMAARHELLKRPHAAGRALHRRSESRTASTAAVACCADPVIASNRSKKAYIYTTGEWWVACCTYAAHSWLRLQRFPPCCW